MNNKKRNKVKQPLLEHCQFEFVSIHFNFRRQNTQEQYGIAPQMSSKDVTQIHRMLQLSASYERWILYLHWPP